MAYNVGNFPDNWIVSDDDQTFYREGFDDTWLEQSLPLPSENGHHLGGQTQDIPRSMSLVHARYATSENSMSSVEESPSMDKPTADDRPRKGRKPKPHMDGESSAERRRTQVRLAQQAYRRRKDATQVSLQDECRHLHELLSEIESTFEDFYTHAAKHNQLLGTNEPRLLLDRTARQLRLLWKSSNCIRPGAMDPYRTGSMLATPYGSLVDIDITKYDDQMHNISLNSPIRQSTQVLSDGNNVSSRSPHPRSSPHKQLQINDTVPQPQIPVFDPCNKPDIPFSARLRYEGLKRGYELLAEKHTPYSIICRVFRFCVFTSTRDQIVNHLETLLQSSGLSTFEVLRMRVPNGWSWDMDNEVEQLSPNNNGFKINSTETALPDKLRSWTEVTSKITPLPYDSIFNYMDAQAVQEYLVSKGLVMNSKASSMALPQNLMNLEGGMFEDFLGRGGILLDVQRLLEELVERAVCLPTGPGFRRVDVDDAVRSALSSPLEFEMRSE